MGEQFPHIKRAKCLLVDFAAKHLARDARDAFCAQRALAPRHIAHYLALLHNERAGTLAGDDVPPISRWLLCSRQAHVAKTTVTVHAVLEMVIPDPSSLPWGEAKVTFWHRDARHLVIVIELD